MTRRTVLAILALVILGGCKALIYQPPPLVTSTGVELGQAMAAARKLEVGMSPDSVAQLIGQPEETEVGTYGGAPGVERWTGLRWVYRWSYGRWQTKELWVFFQYYNDTWVVNSWSWVHF